MKTRTIIGLEIHVELSTKTKMFCSCKNEFGAIPNTNTCPTCLGHPGTLPRINKEAVRYAIMAGLAFNCDIKTEMKMDRKKYFYPDLVKGYQITQQDEPYAVGGYIKLKNGDKIRLNHIHMEEDTAKSNHDENNRTLMDYNRAGLPLIEIVSEPDLKSAKEAREFVEKLAQTLRFLDVSDCVMAEGSMRCDVNINLENLENGKRTAISEIKNLNSMKAIEDALNFETNRHKKMLEDGNLGIKETRRWDDLSQSTISMRTKETTNDYRFSIEGDIPRIKLEKSFIEDIKNNLPELPEKKEQRYIEEYKLSSYDANLLSNDRKLSELFESTNEIVDNPKEVSNWILTELSRRLNEFKIESDQMNLSVKNFAKLINLVISNKINNNVGKKLLREIFESNDDPEKLAKERNLLQISDENFLEDIVNEVLRENPQSIEDIKNGKDRAFGFLVGQAMKKTKGKANPQQVNALLKDKIAKF
ncbi:Asp-tRNA(Asn)/Glu-tRNA(Gln) amidotransferase subunit GatB [Anaerococcus sp. AGMB00486]|uniref:Aspartyl/glutamyl-tRNA(Asn/Gln) amidotransferase subunit B n=2 Tax=Anaerococcus TaxID=165779 RepID=A0ABX2N7A0_9FIRM|nr:MULTISPECIES: Asp-tRNA(Asn)/Glu-tRNA(Gln) amidotransferase subunit GatB [Anaerococcus]MSS76952.1 Asp-tRNA(Asn)/Glu-tRNA(Gln) amidotransferase subunit GatB [Anaerococcus porci]NVF10563.1 Asp-tRNA(Asn)/Glu-tRNA(Gln) amidotransferase subunit GatB [Anaerococcus faecalis]